MLNVGFCDLLIILYKNVSWVKSCMMSWEETEKVMWFGFRWSCQITYACKSVFLCHWQNISA